jgi:hypothetical protein
LDTLIYAWIDMLCLKLEIDSQALIEDFKFFCVIKLQKIVGCVQKNAFKFSHILINKNIVNNLIFWISLKLEIDRCLI